MVKINDLEYPVNEVPSMAMNEQFTTRINEMVADHFGIGGRLLQRGDKEVAGFHRMAVQHGTALGPGAGKQGLARGMRPVQ